MSVVLSSDEVSCVSLSNTGIPEVVATTPGQLVTTEDIPEEVDILEPAVPKCGSNQMVYEWGGKLADPIQLFIDEHLVKQLNKLAVRVHTNAKLSVFKPSLRLICTSLDLVKEGKKEELIKRILAHFLSNPTELDTYTHSKFLTTVNGCGTKWDMAKSHYELECQFHKELLEEDGFDSTVDADGSQTLRVSFLKLCLLGKERKRFSPVLRSDGQSAYITFFGVTYDVAHIEKHLKEASGSQFSKWTIADGGKKTSKDLCARTPNCVYRLINILMMDDNVYARLLTESKSQPISRQSLDTGKKGNTSFWFDVLELFVDDEYAVPEFYKVCEDLSVFTKKDGGPPDISKCQSKWVTAHKLKEWWGRVVADMANFKDGNDRSGQHDFSFEILEDLYENYGKGKKHMLYLSYVALWRGDDALEFVSATLPASFTRDGMGVDAEDDERKPSPRGSATKKKKGPAWSIDSTTPEVSENESMRMLKAAIKGIDEIDAPRRHSRQRERKEKKLELEEKKLKLEIYEMEARRFHTDLKMQTDLMDSFKKIYGKESEQYLTVLKEVKTFAGGIKKTVNDFCAAPSTGDSGNTADKKKSRNKRKRITLESSSSGDDESTDAEEST
jgi:hypothetical protein